MHRWRRAAAALALGAALLASCGGSGGSDRRTADPSALGCATVPPAPVEAPDIPQLSDAEIGPVAVEAPAADPEAFLAAVNALDNAIVDRGSVKDLEYLYDPEAMASYWGTYTELFGLQQTLKDCPQEHYFTVTALAPTQPTQFAQTSTSVTFAVIETTYDNDAQYATGSPGQSVPATPTWELQIYPDPHTGRDVTGWRRTANN